MNPGERASANLLDELRESPVSLDLPGKQMVTH